MKKSFKGFTLIECLIALAILGIASLVMAQIYASVSRINKNNHDVNTSLAYQMKLVEEKTESDRIEIYYGDTTNKADTHSITVKDPLTGNPGDGAPPSQTTGSLVQKNYIEIKKIVKDTSGAPGATKLGEEKYSFPVDIFVLLSRDANDKASNDANYNGTNEKNINLRYRYVLGHKNS